MKIKQDSHGLYIKCGGYIFRPIYPIGFNHVYHDSTAFTCESTIKKSSTSSRLLKVSDGVTNEYKLQVMANPDAIKVKMADLRHNSDITRLKGIRDKDIERMVKYQKFYLELKESQQDER